MTPDEITARLRPLAEKAVARSVNENTEADVVEIILSTFAQPIAEWLAEAKAQASKTARAERDLCIEEIKGLQQDMAATEAAALRKAAVTCTKFGAYMRDEAGAGDVGVILDKTADDILALISPSAQTALDRLLAQARLEEAKLIRAQYIIRRDLEDFDKHIAELERGD